MKKLTGRAALAAVMLFVAVVALAHGGEGEVVVQSVNAGSAAEEAGLKTADVISTIAGKTIASEADLLAVLGAHRPGDRVPITLERDGQAMTLHLTFGERPGGGVSVGVSLAIGASQPETGEDGLTRDECVAWIDETYRVDTVVHDLGLDLRDDAEDLLSCLEDNVQGMPSTMPRAWCDNAFKIHCSAVDLLTEIGEAQVDRCGDLFGEPLSSCAAGRIFDDYSLRGVVSDEAACRAAVVACSEPSS